jgi:sorbitol-specific phosphotransferase system component IIC
VLVSVGLRTQVKPGEMQKMTVQREQMVLLAPSLRLDRLRCEPQTLSFGLSLQQRRHPAFYSTHSSLR